MVEFWLVLHTALFNIIDLVHQPRRRLWAEWKYQFSIFQPVSDNVVANQFNSKFDSKPKHCEQLLIHCKYRTKNPSKLPLALHRLFACFRFEWSKGTPPLKKKCFLSGIAQMRGGRPLPELKNTIYTFIFDGRKRCTSCPKEGEGGVIWAMPERKHLFLKEVFPKTNAFCNWRQIH